MDKARCIALILALTASAAITAVAAAQPYGPDTCRQGYVWREAFPGDHVCVIPEIRAQAAQDNRQANARRALGGGPYGRNTCQQGYVWREAGPDDLVCVTPNTRTQTANDNRQASHRRAVSQGVTLDEGTRLNPVANDNRPASRRPAVSFDKGTRLNPVRE